MKHTLLRLAFFTILLGAMHIANAQTMSPADPNWVFTGTNNPGQPAWSNNIIKWGHTNRLGWNPYNVGYKCYYYKGMVFRLKFPKTYQPGVNDGKKYPIFIFLHGMGERGTIYDNEYQLLHGGQIHQQKVDDGTFDGFLFYPQSTDGTFAGSFPLYNDIIDSLVQYNKGDVDRVILSGLSGGGQADYEYMNAYPKIFAGVLPISAAKTDYFPQLHNYITIPIWLTNGGQDTNPAPGVVTELIDSFRAQGGLIKQTFYPPQGHGVWNSFWSEPDYFPYLPLQHKANPLVYFQHNEFCSNDPVGARLGLQPGFYAYEWQKDGVTIDTATSSEFIAHEYGTYRCRFKRTATSNWSDWSPNPVVVSVKQATVTPPITINGMYSNILPAPDGSNTVPLMVPATYASYEWRRVSDNTLVSTTNIYNAPVGQYKVKVNELYGCSSDFSPIYDVISANGINTPDGVTNVTATTVSSSTIKIDWNDNPNPANNETAFEIYHSKSSGSGYSLAGKVGTDVLTFNDQNLDPNTTYYYIIRAINLNGASGISNEVDAKTYGDNQPPSIPQNLRRVSSSTTSISLAWDPSTDDYGIYKYDLYVNGVKRYITENNYFTVNGLTTGQSYAFYVRARDISGNTSGASNQVNAYALLSGLSYKYYEGTWSSLPDFNALTPVKTGVTPNISLDPRNVDDFFGFLWQGYINIPVSATYQFGIQSDDGSKLYINTAYSAGATPLINNDGLHAEQLVTGTINLTAGVYPIAITFFERDGGEAMKLMWRSVTAGIPTLTPIPDSAFWNNTVPTVNLLPATPSNLTATAISTSKINLNWIDNSSNETGFQLFRSASESGPFQSINISPAGATSYTDSVNLMPNVKYWYKIRSVNDYGVSPTIYNFEAIWNLNNNYLDASGNNRNLSPVNNPIFSTDRKEGSHSSTLNGSNQAIKVSMPANNFPGDAYSTRTIGVWIKAKSSTVNKQNRIIYDFGGKDNGLSLRFNSGALEAGIASNNVRKKLTVSNLLSLPGWNNGGWNHITLVYNVNNLTLFVNAVQAGTTSLTFSSVGITNDLSSLGASTGSNAFNSSSTSSNLSAGIDNIVVLKEAINAADIASFMTYTLQSDTTFALPAIPAAPSGLSAMDSTTSSISLEFYDNSSNENGIEIYRSVNNNTTYRLLTTIPAHAGYQVNYIDSNLFANAAYYYKVRAVNDGGASAYSNEILANTKNNLPVIVSTNHYSMKYGTTETLAIHASDPDEENLTFSFTDILPDFVSFATTGNGKGSFTFTNPLEAQQGNYTIGIVITDSHGGADTMQFILTVNDNNIPVATLVPDKNVDEGSVLLVPIIANDAEGNTGLVWTLDEAPSFASITDTGNGTATIRFSPGFSNAGVYHITARITDSQAAYSTITFDVTVNDHDPVLETIYSNMEYTAPTAAAPWNNIYGAVNNNLLNSDGVATNVGLDFVGASWWSSVGAGAVTGNNSGVYPDAVIQDYLFCGGYGGSVDTIAMTFRGLTSGATYNVTLFGSSNWATFADNGTTIYDYKGTLKPLYIQNNTSKTVTFSSLSPDVNGKIAIRMYKATGSPYAVINSIVLQKSLDDGTVPAMPVQLKAVALDNAGVLLTWKDVAYNESSYTVYRSLNEAGPYAALNPGAFNANDTTYTDTQTESGVQYFYKLEAVNGNGSSGKTAFVTVVTTNRLPVIASFSNIFVNAGQSVNTNVSATDPGDVVTLTTEGLPVFASFTPGAGGTGVIAVSPGLNDMGTYHATLIATDNRGGATRKDFNIYVTDPVMRNVYLNFGPANATPEPAPWNNLLSYPFNNTMISNLVDDAGNNTGFSVKLLSAWQDNFNYGMVTGYNNGIYPDNVMKTSIYTQENTAKSIQIAGLNPAKRYNIVVFSSHNAGISSLLTITSGSSTTLEGMYNNNKSAQLNNLTPNASGIITVSLSKTSTIKYLNLNALVIQEYAASVPTNSIIRPYNLFAETILDSSKVKLTWSDQSSNELGFEIWRSTSQYGTYSLVTSVGANVTTYTNTGLAPNTRYFYKVRSYRNPSYSRIYSSYSNIATAINSPRIVYVNLNVESNMAGPAPWNNTTSPSTQGTIFPDLLDNQSVNSGVEMEITKEFNGTGYTGSAGPGLFPAVVMQSNYWGDANQLCQVKFKNLDITKKYRIGCFGSAIFFGYATANYTCNGYTVQLNSYNNSTEIVYLDNLVPDESGELVVSVKTAPGEPYTFTSAFTLESYTDDGSYTPITTNKVTTPGSEIYNTPHISTANENPPAITQNDIQARTSAALQDNTRQGENINVFPNPFTNKIEVEINTEKVGTFSITLIDMNGRQVYKSAVTHAINGKNKISVNLPGGVTLARGSYLLNVYTDGNLSKSVKLLKIN